MVEYIFTTAKKRLVTAQINSYLRLVLTHLILILLDVYFKDLKPSKSNLSARLFLLASPPK